MLNRVDIIDNKLRGLSKGSYAISEPILQNVEDLDFSGLKNIQLSSTAVDISLSTSVDSLDTDSNVVNGDIIQIKKLDDTISDLTIVGLSTVNFTGNLVPSMTSEILPQGVVSASSSLDIITIPPWHVFSGTLDSWEAAGDDTQPWVQYLFVSSVICTSVGITTFNNSSYRPKDFSVQASNDGIVWVELGNWVDMDLTISDETVLMFDVVSTIPYQIYRFQVYATTAGSLIIPQLTFIGDKNIHTIDTSSITAGEIPAGAYINENFLEFITQDGIITLTQTDSSNIVYNSNSILTTKYYEDIAITGRSIESKITFGATGNIMNQLSADIWKET